MRDDKAHLSDQELLLYIDGEISQHSARRVFEHITVCRTCKERTAELESAFAGFVELHRRRVDAQFPRGDKLRTSLKAQFGSVRETSRFRLPSEFWQQAACAAVLLAIVAAGMWKMHGGFFRPGHNSDPLLASALPNRDLTPGYTRPATLSELCSRRQPNAPPDESISIEQRVFGEYGRFPRRNSMNWIT
jgi:hypothetical protein